MRRVLAHLAYLPPLALLLAAGGCLCLVADAADWAERRLAELFEDLDKEFVEALRKLRR